MPSYDLLVQMDNKQLMAIWDACFDKMSTIYTEEINDEYAKLSDYLMKVENILFDRAVEKKTVWRGDIFRNIIRNQTRWK